jgi:hypothetical protein
MPLPPPLPDPSHIETRLMVVAEMLTRAVDEVHRVMDEIKSEVSSDLPVLPPPPPLPARRSETAHTIRSTDGT